MNGGLHSLVKSVDAKIGWGRVGVLLSVTIIAVAGVVLYRMLGDIDFEEVIDAMEAVEKHDVVNAAMFVAAGYFTLTFYDLFAVRTIGRADIPYRVAALAGFTSYAVGHNIGASAFTGGAVRYRIYSRYGLSAIDVAKVCFVAGLTFWLGNATVLGLGVAMRPRRRRRSTSCRPGSTASWRSGSSPFSPPMWRGCGGPRAWSAVTTGVTLPNGPLTLLQIPSASSISPAARRPCTCWCRTSPISASSPWR